MRFFKLAVCCILFVYAFTTSAQQVVKSTAQPDTRRSIVHYWKDSVSIAYVPEEGSGGGFVYEAKNAANMLFAPISASCEINDFKIMDDTVYFCGVTYWGTSLFGFVGCFDIKDLFFSGGQANICVIPGTILYTGGGRMSNPRRMDVYRSKGIVHIAMAGEMSDLDHPNDPDGATLEDAYFDGVMWHFCNLQNKNNVEYYTDISSTGNYVVAVARDRQTNACYVRAFEASGVYLHNPIYPNYLMEITDSTVRGDILMEAIDTNALALCHYYSDSVTSGLSVKTVKLNDAGQAYHSYATSRIVQSNTPQTGSAWSLREMRYNKALERLYILQDMDYPVHRSAVSTVLEVSFDISTLAVSMCRAIWSGQYGKLHDIDYYKHDGFVSTGNTSDMDLLFFKERFDADTLCHSETRVPVNREPCLRTLTNTDDSENDVLYAGFSYFLTVEEGPTTIHCNN